MSDSSVGESAVLSLELGRRVDRVCDRFEAAWRAGPPPRIEDFLAGWSGPERSALLRELVLLDADYRRNRGLPCSAEGYRRDFPGLDPAGLADALAAASTLSGTALPSQDCAPVEDFPAGLVCLSGAYELGEEIGEGAVGVVHRAHDLGLGRVVAVKVLLPKHRGRAELVRRFVAESQVLGRLQHPGIPAVHGRGELPDGRPFFTMKLVRGQTLEALLQARRASSDERPRFLGLFEQVCQAVAYAHSEGVIHRDLKPANVMVGAFGEVQVMDWNFAKEVDAAPADEAVPAGQETLGPAAATLADPGGGTEGGQVIGTPAYMPTEQARGESADRRSDVFGLGAILCEVLTGQPPFGGKSRQEVHARAQACDHAEALVRLDGCGADAELVRLCKGCLAAEPSGRPQDAGEVARAVAAYQAGVQERLQAAERERAAAQARAEEAKATAAAERRVRRRTAWLAAAVLLLVVAGVGAGWWLQQRQRAADAVVDSKLKEVQALLDQAKGTPLADGGKQREALKVAQNALELARTGGASASVRERAAALVAELEKEEEVAGRDHRLLAWLPVIRGRLAQPPDVRGPRSADEQFANAFREWGLDVDATPTAEAAARLGERPVAVVVKVSAALDEWVRERQWQGKPRAEWQRLVDLAAAVREVPLAVHSPEGLSLVELLRDPQRTRFRLRAEVRHTGNNEWGAAGLYFARATFPSASGLVHHYGALTYNDIRDEKAFWFKQLKEEFKKKGKALPKMKPPEGNQVLLGPRLYPPGGDPPGEVKLSSISGYFKPAGLGGDWRLLAVEVTPDGVKGFLDQIPLGTLLASRWERQVWEALGGIRRAQPKALYVQGPDPVYAPGGGVGLYVYRGSAYFRRVVIEPLDKPN
jgi:serine/threonine protein kinase